MQHEKVLPSYRRKKSFRGSRSFVSFGNFGRRARWLVSYPYSPGTRPSHTAHYFYQNVLGAYVYLTGAAHRAHSPEPRTLCSAASNRYRHRSVSSTAPPVATLRILLCLRIPRSMSHVRCCALRQACTARCICCCWGWCCPNGHTACHCKDISRATNC